MADEVSVNIGLRVPESMHKRLRAVSEDREVSVNRLIQRAITEYLNRLPSAADTLQTIPDPPARRRRAAGKE